MKKYEANNDEDRKLNADKWCINDREYIDHLDYEDIDDVKD